MNSRTHRNSDSVPKFKRKPNIIGIEFAKFEKEYIKIYEQKLEIIKPGKKSQKINNSYLKSIYEARIQSFPNYYIWVIGEYNKPIHKVICLNPKNNQKVFEFKISENFTFRKFDINDKIIVTSFGKSKWWLIKRNVYY
jgi:hypothetical protein